MRPRLLVVLLILQLSALVSAAAGVTTALNGAASCACVEVHLSFDDSGAVEAPLADSKGNPSVGGHQGCPIDGSCGDCAAGCPICRCSKVLGSLAPARSPGLSVQPRPARAALATPAVESPPRGDPSTVFRPPRSASPVV